MAQPSSHLTSLFSPPLSPSRPPITSPNTNENDDASSAVILGDGQRGTIGSLMKFRGRHFTISSLKILVPVLSTLLVVLAAGSVRLGDSPSYLKPGRNNDRPTLLRQGYSKTSHANDVPDFVFPSNFFSENARRHAQETIIGENNVSGEVECDLEYCLATHGDSLCDRSLEEENETANLESTNSLVPTWVEIVIVIVSLCFSALFSGLTLGLMSLDITGLEIVMAGDDPEAAKFAEKIYPLRKRGNLLLCTLLLGNTAVNVIIAQFSSSLFDGTIGFISSTFLILIFGEILPQALCSRYALRIGSAAVPTVKVIRILLFVVTYPLSKALDWMLGRELATTYTNAEMIELLKVHVKENVIDQDEANAMTGALTYKNIHVKDAMTAMEQTFMLGVDEKLSFETIGKIFKTGYSRIPVFEISRNNIIGLLFVKDLIFLDPEDCVPVRSFIQIFGRNVHVVWPDDTLGDVLAVLKKGKSHLAVVRDVNNKDESQDPFYEVKGIITLEDIVERIIGDSIVDETDAFVDSNQSIRVERGETFEWARLRLLDTKIVDEMLSASEIGAITAHLKTNHAESFKSLSDSQLSKLVSGTPVTTLPTATQDLDKELPNELLYEKNVPCDKFTLILSGKVTILVGSENFRSDISSWSVLGANALGKKEWAPDYSAFVSDGPCRFIQISRAGFIEASDASMFERRIAQNMISTAVSVASSNDAESRSMTTASVDGVPNRRQTVLARLFNSTTSLGDDENSGCEPEKTNKRLSSESTKLSQRMSNESIGSTMQFVDGDFGI